MLFRLEVYELVTENDFEQVWAAAQAEVTYEEPFGSRGIADAGDHMATISAFDDSPITICRDHVEIEGIVDYPGGPRSREGYGRWDLYPIEK